jgi:hypothetical protein
VQGNLQDFSPTELIQILGLLNKSGVLRLQRVELEGLIAFRDGRIIYAASPAVRESLGSLLLARGLISETQLDEALAQQASSNEKRRLGAIMVDMGVLEPSTLEELITWQFSNVVSEFIGWDAGVFDFETVEMVDRGEVELEAADFLAVVEVDSDHVLLDAARRADDRLLGGDETSDRPSSLDVLVEKSTSQTIQGEIVHRLLDLGSRTCGRCVLFAVHPERFFSIGRVGLDKKRAAEAEARSRLEVPRGEPSILARAAEQRHSILARLPGSEEDGRILEFLGGPSPSKSVAIPLAGDGQVILVLYGDHLPDDLGTGELEEVEIAATGVVTRDGA